VEPIFQWNVDELLMERDPFVKPYTPEGYLVERMTAFSDEGRGFVLDWVRRYRGRLQRAKRVEELYGLLQELEVAEGEAYARRHGRREARDAADLQQILSILDKNRKMRRRVDPGPVSTEKRAKAWTRKSALREPLYHVTRYGRRIEEEGLKSRSQTRARDEAKGISGRQAGSSGFGGGPGEAVSLTPHRESALRMAAAFEALNESYVNPKGVSQWFKAHWMPVLTREERRRAFSAKPGPGRVKRVIYEATSNHREADPVFTVPWIIGVPSRVPKGDIGVVTAYADVDQVVLSRGTKMTMLSGVGAGAGDVQGFDQVGIESCPPRGGVVKNRLGSLVQRLYPWLEEAAIASSTGNAWEADEIQVCSAHLTVTNFEPIYNWREILMPRRTISKDLAQIMEEVSRGSRAVLSGSSNRDIASELLPLRQAMDEVFSCSTAFGDCHPEAPSAGHCMLASMVVQDLFGGKIVGGTVNEIPHYWNRIGRVDVDVTGDQFGFEGVRVKQGALHRGKAFSRRPQESLAQPYNKKVSSLHKTFVKKLITVLKRQGHSQWAKELTGGRNG